MEPSSFKISRAIAHNCSFQDIVIGLGVESEWRSLALFGRYTASIWPVSESSGPSHLARTALIAEDLVGAFVAWGLWRRAGRGAVGSVSAAHGCLRKCHVYYRSRGIKGMVIALPSP